LNTLVKLITLLIFVLIVPVGSVLAWPAGVHTYFIDATLEMLSKDMQQAFAPYRDELLTAARLQSSTVELNSYNVHSEHPGDIPDYTEVLFSDALKVATTSDADTAQLAVILGKLAVLVADLNDPLHTDNYAEEEILIRATYDSDNLNHINNIGAIEHGARFWVSFPDQIKQSSYRANRFYSQVIEAYTNGKGYSDIERVTKFCARHAIKDIYDVWSTFWTLITVKKQHTISISLNRESYIPGDTLDLTVSAAAVKEGDHGDADLYLAFSRSTEDLSYITRQLSFTATPTPFLQNFRVPELAQEKLVSLIIPEEITSGKFTLYALLTIPGKLPQKSANWSSNLASVQINLAANPETNLHQLTNEAYLLHAKTSEGKDIALPLRRWDLIFTGEYTDYANTQEGESQTADLIPGEFNHLIVYLGRDVNAQPWGMEMTTENLDSIGQGADLRIVRFPEFEDMSVPITVKNFKVGVKNLSIYRTLWAMRPKPELLSLLNSHETQLFKQLEEDWLQGFPYQLEFVWTGSFQSTEIQLVDDGRIGGASCTDYWLSLFEEVAGVCFTGVRISATELENYFLNDPVGSQINIPESFNPFPFSITISQALLFGYHAIDPPAHKFVCDMITETGIPIPDRLRHSNQLIEIEPRLTPVEWQ